MERLDILKRNLKTAIERVEINKIRVNLPRSASKKLRAMKILKKWCDKVPVLEAKIKTIEDMRKKKGIPIEQIIKIQKVVNDFYGVEFDPKNPKMTTMGKTGKSRVVLSYMLAVYFKGYSHVEMSKLIGRSVASISYGFTTCYRQAEDDEYFKEDLAEISSMVAQALGQEIKDAQFRKRQTGIPELAKVRSLKEMPTVTNEWLRPLSKKNLVKREIAKPVYF